MRLVYAFVVVDDFSDETMTVDPMQRLQYCLTFRLTGQPGACFPLYNVSQK